MMFFLLIGGIVGVILLIILFFLSTYTVIDPNEAHVVVQMGSGRKIFSPREDHAGVQQKTAYFFIPFLMRRAILPLAIVKMEIDDFELNDKEMAPFVCSAACWLTIEDVSRVIEKLDLTSLNFQESVRATLEEQVRGVARAAAMGQEILDIMRDRKGFGDQVQIAVNGSLEEWGLSLTNLEIVNFKDANESTVLKDYEKKREAQINAESRKEIALQKKEATVAEAENQRLGELAEVDAKKEVENAKVNANKEINISEQKASQAVQEQKKLTHDKQVQAEKALEVGQAEYKKEAKVITADGEKQKLILEAEGKKQDAILVGEGKAESEQAVGFATARIAKEQGQAAADVREADGLAEARVIEQKGIAEATAIEKAGVAKAVGTDKQAEALKKYNDAGMKLEIISASERVQIAHAKALGEAIAQSNVQIVQGGGDDSIFGMLSPEKGAGLAQTVNAFISSLDSDTKDKVVNVMEAASDAVKSKTQPKG